MRNTMQGKLTQMISEGNYCDFSIHYYEDISENITELITQQIQNISLVKDKRGRDVLNCPMAFDIETTNITEPHRRVATMYHWQMSINKLIILGREWSEWMDVMEALTHICMRENIWSIIYVHNLAYEFQFIRYFFEWTRVFARHERSPIFADTANNIQFRCSYQLCHMSLAAMTKEFHLDIEKEKNYDYDKMRHCKTPMSEQEIKYCINDVASLYYYINKEIKRNGDITKIPYTQTGYVRRALKQRCFEAEKYKAKEYRQLISSLTVAPEEYFALKRAYAGGFTHASVMHVGNIYKDVYSYDIASSYPTVIVSEKYPMSKAKYKKEINFTEYKDLIETKQYCIVADITFKGIRAKEDANEHYIAYHKSRNKEGKPLRLKKGCNQEKIEAREDNGKIIEADQLTITLTDIDYKIIERYYNWDAIQILNVYIYTAAFLPKEVISLAIDLYNDKTKFKGVDGEEDRYLHAKQMLNSIYGMMVTDVINPEIKYTKEGEWRKTAIPRERIEALIEEYNTNRSRTLFYAWGVYVTAYARRNLLNTIWAMGYDYIYSDTDSVKILNHELHQSYFQAYNTNITHKIEYVLRYYGIDANRATPYDTEGEPHPLGHFELDEICQRFKTIGAKRYLFEYYNKKKGKKELVMTVAGVDKKRGAEYLSRYKNPFAKFDFDLIFPASVSGKLIATYTDDPFEGEIDDGNSTCYFEELSCVHLIASDYHMKADQLFLNLLTFCLDKSSET